MYGNGAILDSGRTLDTADTSFSAIGTAEKPIYIYDNISIKLNMLIDSEFEYVYFGNGSISPYYYESPTNTIINTSQNLLGRLPITDFYNCKFDESAFFIGGPIATLNIRQSSFNIVDSDFCALSHNTTISDSIFNSNSNANRFWFTYAWFSFDDSSNSETTEIYNCNISDMYFLVNTERTVNIYESYLNNITFESTSIFNIVDPLVSEDGDAGSNW